MNWIKIKDKMPEKWKVVLVSNGRKVAIGLYDNIADTFFTKPDIDDVSHWSEIELPEKK